MDVVFGGLFPVFVCLFVCVCACTEQEGKSCNKFHANQCFDVSFFFSGGEGGEGRERKGNKSCEDFFFLMQGLGEGGGGSWCRAEMDKCNQESKGYSH